MTAERKEEALNKLLEFVHSKEVFPDQEDYDKKFTEAEQYQLLEDLGAEKDLKLFKKENPRLALFAIFNIEILRYMRRQKGEKEFIARSEGPSWRQDNDFAF